MHTLIFMVIGLAIVLLIFYWASRPKEEEKHPYWVCPHCHGKNWRSYDYCNEPECRRRRPKNPRYLNLKECKKIDEDDEVLIKDIVTSEPYYDEDWPDTYEDGTPYQDDPFRYSQDEDEPEPIDSSGVYHDPENVIRPDPGRFTKD